MLRFVDLGWDFGLFWCSVDRKYEFILLFIQYSMYYLVLHNFIILVRVVLVELQNVKQLVRNTCTDLKMTVTIPYVQRSVCRVFGAPWSFGTVSYWLFFAKLFNIVQS